MSESAVQFATSRRIHIGLGVASVDRSREFYRALFDVEPTKTRSDYARFELSDPPLNLSLIQTEQAVAAGDSVSHFGIQVKSTSAVSEMRGRLESLGLATDVEESVNCCHAVQDKIWIVDPDGRRWEVFVVLDDAPEMSANGECCSTSGEDPCCTVGGEDCCAEE